MNRIGIGALTIVIAAAVVLAFKAFSTEAKAIEAAPERVFELRTYYVNEGKLPNLHKRFREHTTRLFEKHGFTNIGYFEPMETKDGKGDKLVYLLAFPSREAAAKSWKAFQDDPEWKKVYAESHKDGVIVKKVESVFLNPTDYSPMK